MILIIKLPWEWLEYISVAITVVAGILSFFSEQNSLFAFAVTLSIVLNVFNRWRLEARTKNRMAATLNIQGRRFSSEVEEINERLKAFIMEQKSVIKPGKMLSNAPPSDDKIIASLQQDIESLHQSLLSVIDFIKQEEIELRIKNLETLYQALQSPGKKVTDSSNGLQLPDPHILQEPSPEIDLEPPQKIAWKCLHILTAHDQKIADLAISDNQEYLYSVAEDNYLKLWSLQEAQEIDRVVASEDGLTCLAIPKTDHLNDGMVTGSLDHSLKIWSWDRHNQSFDLKHHLHEHTGSIHGLLLASGKKIIISGSFDGTLKQWDLYSGHLLYNSVNDHGGINAIAMNESIELIVAGAEDGIITMWQLDGEKQLGILLGNISGVQSLAISNSGKLIVAGCADGSLKMWQLPTTTFSIFLELTPHLELKGHKGQVMDVLFSSDDRLLYSAGVDGFIRIWHLFNSQEIGHLKINDNDRIFSLALSRDNHILAAGSGTGIIKIWQQYQSPS